MLRLRNPDLQILPCLPKCIHLCRRFRHCFFSSRHLTGLEKLQAARMAKLTVLFLMEIEEQRQVKPPLWDESKPDFSSWASFKSDVCGDLPAGRPSHIKKFSELFPRSGSCIQLCNNLISPLYIKDRILCKQNNQVPSSVGFWNHLNDFEKTDSAQSGGKLTSLGYFGVYISFRKNILGRPTFFKVKSWHK